MPSKTAECLERILSTDVGGDMQMIAAFRVGGPTLRRLSYISVFLPNRQPLSGLGQPQILDGYSFCLTPMKLRWCMTLSQEVAL